MMRTSEKRNLIIFSGWDLLFNVSHDSRRVWLQPLKQLFSKVLMKEHSNNSGHLEQSNNTVPTMNRVLS